MLVSSLSVLVLLHGISSLKVLLILYINFRLPDIVGHASRATPYLIWTVNIAILFLNEIYRGYKFGSIVQFLAFLVRDMSCIRTNRVPAGLADNLDDCAGRPPDSGPQARLARQLQHLHAALGVVRPRQVLGQSTAVSRGE